MAGSTGWTVTGQAETMDVGPNGTYVPGVRVTFRMDNGTTGSVFVPHDQYTADVVRDLITARVATMAAVAGLSG